MAEHRGSAFVRRLVVAVVLLLATVRCAWFGESSTAPPPQVSGDVVLAVFTGYADMHSHTQGSSVAGADATFTWQEIDKCPIGAGNVVDDSRCVDRLRGTGSGDSYGLIYGRCDVKYSAPETSVGTTQGIRIENVGSQVQVIAGGPWSLFRAGGFSGNGCQAPTDPTSRLLDRLVHTTDFSCTLKQNTKCAHSVVLPPSGNADIDQSGFATFEAWRTTTYEQRPLEEEAVEDFLDYLDYLMDAIEWIQVLGPAIQEANKGETPAETVSLDAVVPAPAAGKVTIDASLNGKQVVELQGTAQKGSGIQLSPHWNQSALAATGPI